MLAELSHRLSDWRSAVGAELRFNRPHTQGRVAAATQRRVAAAEANLTRIPPAHHAAALLLALRRRNRLTTPALRRRRIASRLVALEPHGDALVGECQPQALQRLGERHAVLHEVLREAEEHRQQRTHHRRRPNARPVVGHPGRLPPRGLLRELEQAAALALEADGGKSDEHHQRCHADCIPVGVARVLPAVDYERVDEPGRAYEGPTAHRGLSGRSTPAARTLAR
mmetsp:Transcript_3507/g.10193  ORF Transcript_3507/g.10193 Transcript_3507/m.10193 type:complete len:226 (-) Transcript_3507:2-679(-)